MPEPIEIRREKVYVDTSLSIAEIKRKYNIPSSTADAAKKKGFFVKNYRERQIMIDRSQFDYNRSVKIAQRVFYKNFFRDDVANSIKEDLIQEAVVRQFELSGKPNTNPKYNKHYQFMYIAHNAMAAYLKTWIRQMSYSTVDDLFDPEINPIQRSLKRCYSLDFGWSYY